MTIDLGEQGDVLAAESTGEIKEGQMVKLLAVPFDGEGSPSAVALESGEQGEYIGVSGSVMVMGRPDA